MAADRNGRGPYGYDVYREVGAGPRRTGVRRRRGRRRKKKSTLFYSVLLIAALGAAAFLYSFLFNKAQTHISAAITPIRTDNVYQNTGDGLLYQTEGEIHFYHLTDQKKNYTYGTAASTIRMAGSSEMTVVFNERSLQVIGARGDPVTMNGTILAVECGYKYLAVLQEDGSGAQSLVILDSAYKQRSVLTFTQDQYIEDFGFYRKNGERLWIEILSVNSGAPTTLIQTYDITKGDVSGVMQVRDQLVDQIYVTEESIFAVGTNQIIRYTHDNREVYRNTVYGYEALDYTLAGDPTFLMTPRGGDMHSVKMLTLKESESSGATETNLQLPTEGVAAYMMNGSLVVASREKIYVYTLKGKLSREASVDVPVDDAVKLTERILMIASNGVYYLVDVG